VNFEIQPPFFQSRLQTIVARRELILRPGQFEHLCLRGFASGADVFAGRLLEKIKGRKYVLIILDPIYKMLGGKDENKTGDITALVNELEYIALESGAALGFGAHFSKGNQSGKESIDRISGSGVWARDPDTILTMTQHEVDGVFVVEPVLRNLPPCLKFCVRWQFPLMVRDADYCPEDLRKPRKAGQKTGLEPDDKEFLALFPQKWPEGNPREALLSGTELQRALDNGGWDKNKAKELRAYYDKERGLIRVLTGLPHGEILAGRPHAVEAFEKQRAENSQEKKPKKSRPTG
jgi:hypothetical protein